MSNDQRTVWLIRHGNRADFADPAWCDTAPRPHDPPLSPDGVEQATQLGAQLANEKIDHLFASPFLRTVETAAHIADAIRQPIHIEHGLAEMLLERWFPVEPDYIAPSELVRLFPYLDAAYASAVTCRYPETEEDVWARTAHAMRMLLERYEGNLMLVAHGGSIWGLARALLNAEPAIHTGLCCRIRLAQRGDSWTLLEDGSDSVADGEAIRLM